MNLGCPTAARTTDRLRLVPPFSSKRRALGFDVGAVDRGALVTAPASVKALSNFVQKPHRDQRLNRF